MIRQAHPIPCGCDRCRQREADRFGFAMFAGLGTGCAIMALIEAARALFPIVERLLP